VLIWTPSNLAEMAVTSEESRPPERRKLIGLSEVRRLLTELITALRTFRRYSSSLKADSIELGVIL